MKALLAVSVLAFAPPAWSSPCKDDAALTRASFTLTLETVATSPGAEPQSLTWDFEAERCTSVGKERARRVYRSGAFLLVLLDGATATDAAIVRRDGSPVARLGEVRRDQLVSGETLPLGRAALALDDLQTIDGTATLTPRLPRGG